MSCQSSSFRWLTAPSRFVWFITLHPDPTAGRPVRHPPRGWSRPADRLSSTPPPRSGRAARTLSSMGRERGLALLRRRLAQEGGGDERGGEREGGPDHERDLVPVDERGQRRALAADC